MKILYISDRQDGGILRHVRCLRKCLPSEVETFEIGLGGDEEFAGRSGHDIREFWQIRRVIKEFKPDIVHFHIPALLMAVYVRLFTRLPIVRSWHTPTVGKEGFKDKVMRWLLGRDCYYLPVSGHTMAGLKRWAPNLKGEVFYNPVKVNFEAPSCEGRQLVVGMVGRNADVKDWPSFHKVETAVKLSMPNVEFINGGEIKPCNGREEISRMGVFILTSKYEAMPTTLLECFLLKTAVCGFIPIGGVPNILQYSNGPLKEVFIKERDSSRLAEIVISLLNDEAKRKAVVEDGWQILVNHFDAERNCKGQLMDIYRRIMK